MRRHNGMRPQDIPILLKIVAQKNDNWQLQELSNSLYISISEISQSLDRSREAGLVDFNKKRPNRMAINEFLDHGVKYVFPQKPGGVTIGVPTGHSHPFIKKHIISDVILVWPNPNGNAKGESIQPFYEKQSIAALEDPEFYKIMALVDVLRVGHVREMKFAKNELNKILTKAS